MEAPKLNSTPARQPGVSSFHRALKGLLLGALSGAAVAAITTAILIGPAEFFDHSTTAMGTRSGMAIFWTLLFAAIGAGTGAIVGVVVALIKNLKQHGA